MTLLIGTSVLAIAASAIALVFGWITANESLIWTSIATSAAAAVALALAFFRSRQEAAALARGPASSTTETRAAGNEPTADEVVSVGASRRYHRPECRYAKDKTAASMPRSAAHKEGFRPCAICNP